MHSGIPVLGAAASRRGFCLGALAVACLVGDARAAGGRRADADPPRQAVRPAATSACSKGPTATSGSCPTRSWTPSGSRKGRVVADIGAGGGWFTIRLARRVGANGDRATPRTSSRRCSRPPCGAWRREGLGNVRRVLGTAEDPRLPAGPLDAVLIVDTYHEFDEPRRAAARTSRSRSSRRAGWGSSTSSATAWGPGRRSRTGSIPTQVVRDAEAAGLRLVRRETFLPYQFLLVFSRPQPGALG
ncbi:MAG: hypothetical protein M0C28_13480 [Candidatus Moduliflexus flocculans]|nr:hypothetical protein [Candidatus Moduliflexus flocculans]